MKIKRRAEFFFSFSRTKPKHNLATVPNTLSLEIWKASTVPNSLSLSRNHRPSIHRPSIHRPDHYYTLSRNHRPSTLSLSQQASVTPLSLSRNPNQLPSKSKAEVTLSRSRSWNRSRNRSRNRLGKHFLLWLVKTLLSLLLQLYSLFILHELHA